MNPFRKFYNAWHAATYHYRLFGKDGLRFLWKKRNHANQLLDLTIKDYTHPLYLRNNTTDLPMFYHIFASMDYALSFEEAPRVILDCGAHIGLGAVYFANRFPGATIIAVEAERSNYEMLVKNTKPYPQVHAVHGAIWNSSIPLKVVDPKLGNWGYMTEPAATNEEAGVQAITIPALMALFKLDNIDLCKINIEGAEKELFEDHYMEWLTKTKMIVIELHDHMRKGCAKTFFNALSHLDYSVSLKGFSLVIHLNPSPASLKTGNQAEHNPTT